MKNPNTKNENNSQKSSLNPIYKIFKIFTDIRPGEGLTTFLLTFNVYLLLLAYYIIKPVREALILAGKGAEIKSYLSAAMVITLIPVIKSFSSLASKVSRQILIAWVTVFFISNLVIFYLLSLGGIGLGTMGIIFFIWVGIFNVMVIAQFWGFANDIFSEEKGKRLFPLVAFGATFGALSGSTVAGWLVEPIGVYQMMLVSAGVLGICILLTFLVHINELKHQSDKNKKKVSEKIQNQKEQTKPLKKGGGFKFVFKKRYLIYLAFFVLLLNFINTNGEYILGNIITSTSEKTVEGLITGNFLVKDLYGFYLVELIPKLIGNFYADFFSIVNLLTAIIQLFIVSRIFKWFGVRVAALILPFIALGGYIFITFGATLAVIRWVKTLENSTDYSLMNTTRHALFLPTSREEKYKAKAAIDTFFHRAGDVFSALLVLAGTSLFAFKIIGFAQFNIALVLIWIFLGFLLIKEHKRLTQQKIQ